MGNYGGSRFVDFTAPIVGTRSDAAKNKNPVLTVNLRRLF